MKEILTSSSFENEILSGNEDDSEIKKDWNDFKNNMLIKEPEIVCCA